MKSVIKATRGCHNTKRYNFLFDMKLNLLYVLLITAVRAAASVKCSSEKCCLVDIPSRYCAVTLPNEPMNISTKLIVRNLEEVDETKLSYTITIR